MNAWKAIFRGTVQGVGFRATVKKIAQDLQYFGTVRNLSNGGVELVVLGDRPKIERLIKALTHFHIEEVLLEPCHLDPSIHMFTVISS